MSSVKCFEVGGNNNLPHYAVIGSPHQFYLWVNECGDSRCSEWLTGKNAFRIYHNLLKIHKKNKTLFCNEVKKLCG